MEERATHASLRRSHHWAGLSCLVYDVHWDAGAGWLSLSFERPTLCFLVEEVGGRAELRARPDTPAEGEYFGTDHLTLLAAADPITLYSTSIRSANFAERSPTQFGHAFRESTGLSPQRWQMDARVRFAQRLMVDNPALSLSLIALRSGFADQSHFSRAFLDILGTTPTAWLHQRR